MSEISFDVSRDEMGIIRRIAKRAVAIAAENGVGYAQMDAEMDITAAHANGCALDLKKLLEFNENDFGHDIFGIRKFINHQTDELGGCFVPRCAMRGTITQCVMLPAKK